MKTRKKIETEKVNALLEQRYLHNKFIKEESTETQLKLTATPVEDKGSVKKWKVSLFVDKNDMGLKDLMDNIKDKDLEDLGLKREYVSADSAQLDINNVDQNKLKDLFKQN
jgi:hypothetical protein